MWRIKIITAAPYPSTCCAYPAVLIVCAAVGEARRAEALAAILAKQQEAAANVREAAERRRAAEAERLAQLEHRQRRKEEMQVCLSARVCTCTHTLGLRSQGRRVAVLMRRKTLSVAWAA